MTADQTDEDAGIRFPPPLVFLGLGLLGWTIERRLRIEVELWPDWIGWTLAAAIAAAGVFLIANALAMFSRAGTRPEPWAPTATITRSGVYGRTRNPMYLGMLAVVLAAASGLQSPGILSGAILAVIVIDRFVVRREEAYLLGRFGGGYADYLASVRRWL